MKHSHCWEKTASLSWVYTENALRDKNSPATSLKAYINRIILYVSVWICYFDFSFFQLRITIWTHFRHFFTSFGHFFYHAQALFLLLCFCFKLAIFAASKLTMRLLLASTREMIQRKASGLDRKLENINLYLSK